MSGRVNQTYTRIYGTPPQLKEPYRRNTYDGSAGEYVEMLTDMVSTSNQMAQTAVTNPAMISAVLGGRFNPNMASVASGRGVTPNLP